jgi:hypothetical protein
MLQFLNTDDLPMQISLAIIMKTFNFHHYLYNFYVQKDVKGAVPADIEQVSAA